MYIFKNALRNVLRAKGRSILIFVLVLIIAVSACVALSIQNSAERAKESSYDAMSVTATIGTNRENMMGQMSADSENMMDIMSLMSQSIELEELEVYAQAESVSDFHYSGSISLDIYDETLTSYSTDSSSMSMSMGMMEGMEGMGGMSFGSSGDFTITGYSAHDAMTEFVDGTLSIIEGYSFYEGDTSNAVLISEEIALLNDLSAGETITLVNPSKEDELIELTIWGIFSCETTDSFANNMYMSIESVQAICDASAEDPDTYTDEDTEIEYTSELSYQVTATYVFEDPTAYETFSTEAEALGLDLDSYSITSTDLTEFNESLVPLESLSEFTMISFIVILLIGALILIVFNLFTVRERKYEIGVLAAIGMPKPKVAMQFITEVIIVTFVAILVGAGIGAIIANPLGDMLLESQIESTETQSNTVNENFGGNFSGSQGGMPGMEMGSTGMFGSTVDYIDELNTSIDLLVMVQLMGLGLLLSVLASSVGIVSVLRYEPLKILSERA